MKNLNPSRFPPVAAPSNDVHLAAPPDAVLTEIVALRRFLHGRALLLTQDPSAAEDLVQNALERALVARVTFQAGTNLKAWLSVILRNLFFDDCRHARAQQRISRELEREPHEEGPATDPADPRDVLVVDDVVESLDGLSARDREVFELFYLRRLPYRQIADRLRIPPATVGTRLLRSKRRVRAALVRRFEARRRGLLGDAVGAATEP